MESGKLEEIFIKNSDSVYRLAFSQMKNKADADDIFSQVFMKLVKYKGTFESDEHIHRWLLRVTINLCASHFRSYWHKNITLTEVQNEIAVFETESQREIYSLVMALPKKYRSVIHLFYYEGYSVPEIAEITECRTGTVTSQLSRAREMLKKELKEDFSYEH